jgi:hypothetical protein
VGVGVLVGVILGVREIVGVILGVGVGDGIIGDPKITGGI